MSLKSYKQYFQSLIIEGICVVMITRYILATIQVPIEITPDGNQITHSDLYRIEFEAIETLPEPCPASLEIDLNEMFSAIQHDRIDFEPEADEPEPETHDDVPEPEKDFVWSSSIPRPPPPEETRVVYKHEMRGHGTGHGKRLHATFKRKKTKHNYTKRL